MKVTDALVEIFKYSCVGTILLLISFLVLLSLPSSRLKGVLMEVYSAFLSAVTMVLIVYILNPLDVLPDMIPIIGQADDAVAVIGALFTGVTAFFAWKRGRRILSLPREDEDLPKLPS